MQILTQAVAQLEKLIAHARSADDVLARSALMAAQQVVLDAINRQAIQGGSMGAGSDRGADPDPSG